MEGKPFGHGKAKTTTSNTSAAEEEKEKKPGVEGGRKVSRRGREREKRRSVLVRVGMRRMELLGVPPLLLLGSKLFWLCKCSCLIRTL